MRIAYFDEVKFQKGRMPFYWLGAIVADGPLIHALEAQVNRLAEDVFGRRTLTKDTEFHASDLLSGNGHFEDWDLPRRVEVINQLVTILGSARDLGKIYVKLVPDRMTHSDDVEGIAFMYLLERINQHLEDHDDTGILIGDRENEVIAGKFAEKVSHYREWGTRFEYGTELRNLVDTVHFTHSHHSRMLQLADLHVWLRQLCAAGAMDKWHRQAVLDHVQQLPGCLHAHRYKYWPPEPRPSAETAEPSRTQRTPFSARIQ